MQKAIGMLVTTCHPDCGGAHRRDRDSHPTRIPCWPKPPPAIEGGAVETVAFVGTETASYTNGEPSMSRAFAASFLANFTRWAQMLRKLALGTGLVLATIGLSSQALAR